MANPTISPQGWVARSLSKARAILDGNQSDGSGPRMSRYQEQMTTAAFVGEYAMCDEGTLMMAGMLPGATTLQLGINAGYTATVGCFVFCNNAPAGPSSPRCHLRDIHFVVGAVPTSGTSALYATALDNVNRAPTTVSGLGSPGTPAAATAYRAPSVCSNIDENTVINGTWWFPLSTSAAAGPVLPAQGPNARILVGNGILRQAIPVALDDYRIVFGATDRARPNATNPGASVGQITEPHPAVTVGPQEYFIFNMWFPSNATNGITFSQVDCTWVER